MSPGDALGVIPDEAARNGHVVVQANPLLAGRVLLREAMEKGVEPPEELEPGVLLRGKVHHVFSASGLGKTMLGLWFVKRCIERGQRIVYFDDENGVRTISERLQDMGVDPARVDELLYYLPFPSLPMTEEARRNYAALLEDIEPDLVVFDSWINFLASAGLNENENTDIQMWCTAFTKPARDEGITVVILDHVPHEGSRARGASRKKDEADVQWQLFRNKPYSRDSTGEVVLRCEKDRDSWLEPSVTFSVGGTSDGRLIFERSAGTVEEPDPADGLTPSARALLDVLVAKFAIAGANASEWAVAAGVSRQTVYRSKVALIGRGLVEVHRKRYYPSQSPDREGDITREPGATKPDLGEVSHGVTGRNNGPGVTGADGVTPCNTPFEGVTGGTPPPSTPQRNRAARRVVE